MSAWLIFGLAVVCAAYSIAKKIIELKEWNMKYNTPEVKERRIDKWGL